jgi:hypothetical protein
LEKAFDLGRTCDLIGYQDAPHSAPGQGFRFAQRGTGDADCTVRQLPPGKGHTFVVLIVWAQAGWPFSEECGHPAEIGFHGIHVD